MNEVRVCGGRRETYLWMRSRGVWASFPTSHFHHFHPQWTDEAVHGTPQPSRELNPSESIICLVNTKLLLNEPELMQLLPKLNLLANCSRGAARKTHTANKQISTRPAEKSRPLILSYPDEGPSLRKRQVTINYIHTGANPRVFRCEYHLSILTSWWRSSSINNRNPSVTKIQSMRDTWEHGCLRPKLLACIPTGSLKNILNWGSQVSLSVLKSVETFHCNTKTGRKLKLRAAFFVCFLRK